MVQLHTPALDRSKAEAAPRMWGIYEQQLHAQTGTLYQYQFAQGWRLSAGALSSSSARKRPTATPPQLIRQLASLQGLSKLSKGKNIPMADHDAALSTADYWDKYYGANTGIGVGEEGGAPTHEWFRSFDDIQEFLGRNLFNAIGHTPSDNPWVVHIGSGDSEVPIEFALRGYKHQTCLDFSSTVVQRMTDRHASYQGIEWKLMDVRDMVGIDTGSVDVCFDKGTFDAMIHGSPWSPPDDVRDNTGRYLREVHRILKPDGVFLWVTFRQPHFMRPLLSADGLFDLDLQVLAGSAASFEYYGWVVRKKQTSTAPTEEATE